MFPSINIPENVPRDPKAACWKLQDDLVMDRSPFMDASKFWRWWGYERAKSPAQKA
eukprot:NODE_5407_length_579_cov_53.318868_g4691_i0.p5 GENE.NODE_5407_length_579_cov_53.318868_g4691_i0~~NODE_5407_length_579_cov_53.318868_g4691_i0.p5  ORF type:complete len:56 (+),score=8.08 NODE_5407_length_579_cov_53.318868_g4691_i0:266-433(+)